jgi:hypothetical protein
MNKIQYFLFLSIYFSKTVYIEDPDVFPKDSISLAKGFFDASGLKDIMNITKCENEFNKFVYDLTKGIDQLLNNDGNAFATVGMILIDMDNIRTKCVDNEFGRKEISNYIYVSIRNPQKFLLAVLDNIFSFHIAGRYLELKGFLKENRMYDTGKTLGDMAKYIMNIHLKEDTLLVDTSNDCEYHYINFIGSVYNMLNTTRPSMSMLLGDMNSLVQNCK